MSISKLIRYHEQVMNMRELSEQLYLTRREFIKGLVAVSAVSVTGLSGCLEYIKPKTPEPAVKKRFTPELRIEGDEEFKRNVERMLSVLKEYSPEWYEKTMYAGEIVKPSSIWGAAPNGDIYLNEEVVKGLDKNDIKRLLQVNARFPHEVQHVIDRNVYGRWSEIGELDSLESELRAGIASKNYDMQVGFMSEKEVYDDILSQLKEGLPSELKVDTEKHKDKIDALEKIYFDRENKRVKMGFLDESWRKFKNL